MELIVFICVLIAVFTVEVIYYRSHALDNLNLKVDFSKNVADFGEDVEPTVGNVRASEVGFDGAEGEVGALRFTGAHAVEQG